MQMGDYELEDGFSSNEQAQEQEPISAIRNGKLNDDRPFATDLVLNRVEPPPEIKQKHYSLEPDIITGWAPKMFMPKPVRLIFENTAIEHSIRIALHSQGKHHLCFLGPRFANTYSAWKALDVPFPYNYMNEQRVTLTDRYFVGMNPRFTQESLTFDSLFESGNLDAVFRVDEREYNLFMRVDANTKGHLQWFYFKVGQLKANQKYKFNIYNFQKAKTLYARGMKPYFFSEKEEEANQRGWFQGGEEITYSKNTASPEGEGIYDKQGKLFKLSFLVSTEYEEDRLSIAYCPPYTYTRLNQFLSNLMIKCIDRNIITQDYLCISLGGFKLPLLTITSQADEEQLLFKKGARYRNKKMIFVMARVHPGQCNGSYMVQGFIKWLCGHSPESNEVRHRYVFKILPMANPDGVIIGNYRTGLSGKDFNRQFISPNSQIFVQVHELKKFLQRCRSIYANDFSIFMDFHGHTVKKNVFTYGPQFSITDHRYYESKLLPKLIGRRTSLFRFHSCVFKITPSKESTARAVLLKELRIPFAYTVQASNGSYYDHEEMRDVPFSPEAWLQVGQNIGEAVFDYWQLFKVLVRKKEERNKEKELSKLKKDRNKRIQSSMIRSYQQSHPGAKERYKSSLSNLKMKQLHSQEILNEIYKELTGNEEREKCSDDQLSEGRSDSESEDNDIELKEISIIQEDKRVTSQSEKRSHVKILKALKKSSMVEELEQGGRTLERQRKLFDIPREKIQIRKKVQSISGTPSPVKESESNTAKIVNISFALNPISAMSSLQDQRSKKVKTEAFEAKTENRRASRQEQFDSYRKTYLSLQRDGLRKEQLKRKTNMNNTFSNGARFKMQEIVGRRIFTETAL